MPNMSGIKLLKAMRMSEEWKDLTFLMVLAEGQKEQVLEVVKNRVSHYIVKPFPGETMTEKMHKIFENQP